MSFFKSVYIFFFIFNVIINNVLYTWYQSFVVLWDSGLYFQLRGSKHWSLSRPSQSGLRCLQSCLIDYRPSSSSEAENCWLDSMNPKASQELLSGAQLNRLRSSTASRSLEKRLLHNKISLNSRDGLPTQYKRRPQIHTIKASVKT